MKIDTLTFRGHWTFGPTPQIVDRDKASIVFVFGDSDDLATEPPFSALRTLYPRAHIVGASSAGHILGSQVADCPIVATAVELEKGNVAVATVDFDAADDVETIAQKLVSQLPEAGLKHVFVLSEGLQLNGSALVRGINAHFKNVPVTGGMAGDGARFAATYVVADAPGKARRIVAVGFYGEALAISSGCYSGWSEFGVDRLITKSAGNVLYELDHQPALDLYKKYLGEFAADLPLSGMRFPLSIKEKAGEPEVIRSLLGINEADKSITFAGDVPEGYLGRLMKPDIDVLIDGAKQAAENVAQVENTQGLGLVVSCTGRKIVMSQLVEEELEVVEDVLGKQVQLAGFYSYGEIAPFHGDVLHCRLHNQTMTLTVVFER